MDKIFQNSDLVYKTFKFLEKKVNSVLEVKNNDVKKENVI